MVWRTKAMAKDVQTHFYPHKGFDELEQSKIDEMNYEHYHVHSPAEESELPLKWHEAAPCAQLCYLYSFWCVYRMRGTDYWQLS